MHVSEVEFALNSINPLSIGVKPVKAQFILHPEPDQQACCQTDGQASQVNQRIQFVTKQVPKSNLEVAP
jgi:hypothetical protein